MDKDPGRCRFLPVFPTGQVGHDPQSKTTVRGSPMSSDKFSLYITDTSTLSMCTDEIFDSAWIVVNDTPRAKHKYYYSKIVSSGKKTRKKINSWASISRTVTGTRNTNRWGGDYSKIIWGYRYWNMARKVVNTVWDFGKIEIYEMFWELAVENVPSLGLRFARGWNWLVPDSEDWETREGIRTV